MKRICIILALLLLTILIAVGCNTSPSDIKDALNDDKDTIKLADDLLQGRWVGHMKADITAGGPGTYKTVGGYDIDLQLVFTEHPDHPGEPQYRAFNGIATIRYQEPKWANLGIEGIASVDYDLLTPSITAPVSGRIAHVGSPEKWGQPAQMLFDNRDLLYATLTTTIVYDVSPPHTDIITDKGSHVPMAELFVLTHLRNIGFMPKEEGRIEFSPLSISNPLKDPIIEGYLYRVQEKDLSSPPQPGEKLDTEKDEAFKFKFPGANSNDNIETILEPNSSLEVLDSSEYDALLGLMLGELHSRTSGAPLRWEVRSPVAIAGVRGTDFSMKVLDDGHTTLTVFDGTVDLTCRKTNKTVSLTSNQYATVCPEEGISEVKKLEVPSSLPWW